RRGRLRRPLRPGDGAAGRPARPPGRRPRPHRRPVRRRPRLAAAVLDPAQRPRGDADDRAAHDPAGAPLLPADLPADARPHRPRAPAGGGHHDPRRPRRRGARAAGGGAACGGPPARVGPHGQGVASLPVAITAALAARRAPGALYTPDETTLRKFGLVRAVGGGAYLIAAIVLAVIYGWDAWPLLLGAPVLAIVTTVYFLRCLQYPRTSVAASLVADAVVL